MVCFIAKVDGLHRAYPADGLVVNAIFSAHDAGAAADRAKELGYVPREVKARDIRRAGHVIAGIRGRHHHGA